MFFQTITFFIIKEQSQTARDHPGHPNAACTFCKTAILSYLFTDCEDFDILSRFLL